jgi:hypothetical protein
VSNIAVVHYLGATMRSRSVVASLLTDLVDDGHEVSLLNISHFSTITQDLPPAWIARALGQKVFHHRFGEVLKELQVTHYRPLSPSHGSVSPPANRWDECLQALDSELLTYFRLPSLSPESRAMARMRELITNNALATYSAISSWLGEHETDELIIPNGRTSRQKIARVAAEELGIAVRFYENGRARRNSYYLGTTQPHDRLASQKEVAPLTKNLSSENISQLAEQWLEERMNPSSGTNSFSAAWGRPASHGKLEGAKPLAVFFPSSTDEFLAFGPMWNIDEWESQFQAFDLMMGVLEKRGCDLVLRFHPSLGEKSRDYFRQTVAGIKELQGRHPSLVVHWHNSPINSYDLVSRADYVIVERSTIGLEANLMGKPVWLNQAAQWDLVADVRQALSPLQITEEFLTPWDVDVAGAQRFVAYWMLQEHPLRYSWDDWATWDPDAAPWFLRLATLLNDNPWFHRLQLLRNAFTAWRNDRFTGRDLAKEVG